MCCYMYRMGWLQYKMGNEHRKSTVQLFSLLFKVQYEGLKGVQTLHVHVLQRVLTHWAITIT